MVPPRFMSSALLMYEIVTTTCRRSALAKDESRRQNLDYVSNQSEYSDEASDSYCTSEEEYLPIAGTKSGEMKTRETLLAANPRKAHIEGFERETRSLRLSIPAGLWNSVRLQAEGGGQQELSSPRPHDLLGFASQTLPCQKISTTEKLWGVKKLQGFKHGEPPLFADVQRWQCHIHTWL